MDRERERYPGKRRAIDEERERIPVMILLIC
jgi:hypothetical protein